MNASLAALQAALAVEHEVVYGYGIVAAHLRGPARRLALGRLALHQQRRDDLASLVTASGGRPLTSAAAYALPLPVRTADDAARLATRLEDAAATAAYDVVGATPAASAGRRLAVSALADCAKTAATWRARHGPVPQPVFPGRRG